jgi:REP element-mobilizing transposase RayT
MSRPPRLPAGEYLGRRPYFLTICCHHRRAQFVRPNLVDLVLQHFLHAAVAHEFAITAYCFMPDHMHALVEAESDQSDLRAFVSLAKQRSGYYFQRAAHTRLWQEGYYDRVPRSNEPQLEIIRYIVSNPVRAGIVAQPDHYPYWGSQVYSRQELLEAISRP